LDTPRIAILILAHKNQEQLIKLVDHFKADFAIYVHIDRNSKIQINNEHNVHSIKKFKAYWGSYNLVLATRELMKIAATGNHDRYLLISGQDLPIMSNEEIIQYFTGNRNNYLAGEKLAELKTHQWRMRNFHFNLHSSGKLLNKLLVFVDYKVGMLQNILKLWCRFPDNLYVGCEWFNLTHEAVMICLEKMYDKKYINQFKYGKCSDEIVVQSILYNSELMSSIKNDDLRYTDWSMGGSHPKLLTLEDYNKIINSGKIFARKFDDTIDAEVIDKIYQHVA
jgi:hypothetical protein